MQKNETAPEYLISIQNIQLKYQKRISLILLFTKPQKNAINAKESVKFD